MNTKIGTSLGLTALMAIGVLAVMLALGVFSAQKASAGDPVPTAITATPSDPGDTATIKLTFTTDEIIQGNSGEIWVRFDKNYSVPSTISKNLVTITTSQSTGGTSNPLIDPTIEVKSSSNVSTLLNDTIVKITLGDTVPSSTGTVEDMHPATGHIITFASSAGIKLPTSSSSTAHMVRLSTSSGATYQPTEATTSGTAGTNAIATSRVLTLSKTSGGRGTSVTATGKGFSSTGSATLFIDDDDDGSIDTTEFIIASGISVSSGSFTQAFTTDTNFTGAQNINAIDGSGTSVSTTTNPTFTTSGLVTADKAAAARGEQVKVSLAQYTASGVVTSVKFGGVEAKDQITTAALTVGSDGTLTMTLTVPTTTPLGVQQIAVAGAGESATRTTTIEITGAPVNVSPTSAVAQQSITVSGSGFTPGGSATISANSITVGGTAATHSAVTIDNSGNMVVSFKVPDSAATRTAQTTKVRITDSGGRIGEANLVIPARTLTLGEDTSKRGTVVSVNGSGFEASSSVSLTYTSGGTDHSVGNATADSAGLWSTTFTVPTATTVGIPSTNTLKAAFTSKTTTTVVNTTVVHKVPGATITIDPVTAQSGDTITVTGSNFPSFASVSVLTIGGTDARPVPSPATDTNGDVTIEVLVPGATAGTATVLVTAGSVTANTPLTIEAATATTTPTTNATEDVFADVIADDNLVRVWRFSNADQSWAFYDPRPAFAAANSLTDASSGDIVWVNVTAEQEFQGQTLFPGWNLISLD